MDVTSNISLALPSSGLEVKIERLDQGLVYSGMLEGVPTVELNKRIVEAMRERVFAQDSAEPFVVEPEMRTISLNRPYPFGEPASIPPVGCSARLRTMIDGTKVELLTAIWFQDEYALPIAPTIVEQIDKQWDRWAKVELL